MGDGAYPTAPELAEPSDQQPYRREGDVQKLVLSRSSSFSIREITFGLVALSLCLFPSYSPLTAEQVTGRTLEISEEEAEVEINSPLLLEVPLPVKFRIPLRDRPKGSTISWTTTETSKYVCDKARVELVSVTKTKMYLRGRHHFDVTLQISSEWYRQDVNLTISLIVGDEEIERKFWDDLTVGADKYAALPGSSNTKMPTAHWRFSDDQIAGWFVEGRRPILRVVVEIQ